MALGTQLQRICHVQIHRLLSILVVVIAVVGVPIYFVNYGSISILSISYGGRLSTIDVGGIGLSTSSNTSNYTRTHVVHEMASNSNASSYSDRTARNDNDVADEETDSDFVPDDENTDKPFEMDDDRILHNELTVPSIRGPYDSTAAVGLNVLEEVERSKDGSIQEDSFGSFSAKGAANLQTDSSLDLFMAVNISLGGDKEVKATKNSDMNNGLLQTVSFTSGNGSFLADKYVIIRGRRGIKPTSFSDMNSLLLQTSVSSKSVMPKLSSPRDHELQRARSQIESAPIVRNAEGLHASIFRNVSMLYKSYRLMERILKVYIYKDGEKPLFHRPKLKGIYASEGWFMKLMEGNKKFVVNDPRKAHLFYLPFSTKKLRDALYKKKFSSSKDLEIYLEKYVEIIASRYRFWNRSKGADHFLVACHDWGPRLTRKSMGNCIRVLCNSNIGSGFKIGKDVSLPVTLIHTAENTLDEVSGNPPSERHILAFFAGSMHGYLRPILLQYWNNKETDMKIFGPMPHDIEGKMNYSEYMRRSKYCICARGYEVHTPRVIEAIYHECVPVIISDNYVPPFFEVLNWEAFSVFILEREIPNLRNILTSIPEEKYLAMQHNVKMVQQHFLWQKNPVKYDLFHMILHSVWSSRVFRATFG